MSLISTYVNLPVSIAVIYLGWNFLAASASRRASWYLPANKSCDLNQVSPKTDLIGFNKKIAAKTNKLQTKEKVTNLTQAEIDSRSVGQQLGIQGFIITVGIDSFSVTNKGVLVFPLLVFFVTFIVANLCNFFLYPN